MIICIKFNVVETEVEGHKFVLRILSCNQIENENLRRSHPMFHLLFLLFSPES